MNKAALYHRPVNNYAYANKIHEIQIRFRTAKDDVERVNLFFGSKFDWGNKQKRVMNKIATDEYFDYYQYDIVAQDMRLGYYFEVIKEQQVVYYTEAGILDTFDDQIAYCLFFQYPFVHEIDLYHEPTWLKDAV